MAGRPVLLGDKDRLIPPELRAAVLHWLDAQAQAHPDDRPLALARLAILLMDGAGLRVSEVVRLQARDCDVGRAPYRLLIRGAKHRAKDHVDVQTIGRGLAEALRPQLAALAPERYVVGGRTRPYTRQRIRTVVKAVHQACAVDPIYACHSWRHGYGTRVYLETRDLVLTSRMLRHRSTQPTEKYVHMATEMEAMGSILDAVEGVGPAPAPPTPPKRPPAPRSTRRKRPAPQADSVKKHRKR